MHCAGKTLALWRFKQRVSDPAQRPDTCSRPSHAQLWLPTIRERSAEARSPTNSAEAPTLSFAEAAESLIDCRVLLAISEIRWRPSLNAPAISSRFWYAP